MLRAIYREPVNCDPCLDMYPFECTDCKRCMELHTEEVNVLQIGVGVFANKAVIIHKDGKMETVLMDRLTIKGVDADDSE